MNSKGMSGKLGVATGIKFAEAHWAEARTRNWGAKGGEGPGICYDIDPLKAERLAAGGNCKRG